MDSFVIDHQRGACSVSKGRCERAGIPASFRTTQVEPFAHADMMLHPSIAPIIIRRKVMLGNTMQESLWV
jgi:hypothetical protein